MSKNIIEINKNQLDQGNEKWEDKGKGRCSSTVSPSVPMYLVNIVKGSHFPVVFSMVMRLHMETNDSDELNLCS
jgi:hypothetical protein